MTAPSIIHTFDGDMIGPLLLAFLTTAFFGETWFRGNSKASKWPFQPGLAPTKCTK